MARGEIARRAVPEAADAMCGISGGITGGITGTSAATPRSIASTGVAWRTVWCDGAGALFETSGALFDGVVLTESILACSVIGYKA